MPCNNSLSAIHDQAADDHAFVGFADACREAPLAAAVILGSGAGAVADRVGALASLPFGSVPGLGFAGVAGHRGRLKLCDWANRRVLLFEGRLHYYEGHDWATVVRPVHIAHELGARLLVLTNAAGGIHELLDPGAMMIIRRDLVCHGPRFWLEAAGILADQRKCPYSARLVDLLLHAGQLAGLSLMAGTYASLTGPSYETPAEIRALKTCRADAVGMSTSREAAEAVRLGMECAALSCISNKAAGLTTYALCHEEVLANMKRQAERLASLLEQFLTLV